MGVLKRALFQPYLGIREKPEVVGMTLLGQMLMEDGVGKGHERGFEEGAEWGMERGIKQGCRSGRLSETLLELSQ